MAGILINSGQYIKGLTISCPQGQALGGRIDMTGFTGITGFFAPGLGITSFGPSGFNKNPLATFINISGSNLNGSMPAINLATGLKNFYCNNSQINGVLPPLSDNRALVYLQCQGNNLSGAIPDLSRNAALANLYANSNNLTGPIPPLTGNPSLGALQLNLNSITGSIPSLASNPSLLVVQLYNNNLQGVIPSLTANTLLNTFQCYINNISGVIPSLSANTALVTFRCNYNNISGSIPNLSNNVNLTTFYCGDNSGITGYMGGTVTPLLKNIQVQNCSLAQSAVDALLAVFVAAGATNGTLTMAGNNSAPSASGYNNRATLISRGWTVSTK
jgi:hypothetical protein